jgi:hypothetical protein
MCKRFKDKIYRCDGAYAEKKFDCDGDGYLDWTCDSVAGMNTSSWIRSEQGSNCVLKEPEVEEAQLKDSTCKAAAQVKAAREKQEKDCDDSFNQRSASAKTTWCGNNAVNALKRYDCDGDGILDWTCHQAVQGKGPSFAAVVPSTHGSDCFSKGETPGTEWGWAKGSLLTKCPAAKLDDAATASKIRSIESHNAR